MTLTKLNASIQLADDSLDFSKLEELPNKVRVKISINTHQQVANNTHFTKEVLTKNPNDLDYLSVVGYYKENDFSTHGGELVKGEDGVIRPVKRTKSYGTTIAGTKKIENIDGQEYITVEAYVWTGLYPELAVLFEGEPNNQSMEIKVKDTKRNEDGTIEILDFEYKALCILGKEVEPAFDKAKVITILEEESKEGKEDFKKFMQTYFEEYFEKILTELKNNKNQGEDYMSKQANTATEPKTIELAEYEKLEGENKTLKKTNKEFEDSIAGLTKKVLELKEEVESYAGIKEELETLKKEKFQKELEGIFEKANETLKEEDVAEFKKNIMDMKNITVEEVETKLFALIGQKALKGELKTTEKEVVKEDKEKEFKKEIGYGLEKTEVEKKTSGKSYDSLFAKHNE